VASECDSRFRYVARIWPLELNNNFNCYFKIVNRIFAAIDNPFAYLLDISSEIIKKEYKRENDYYILITENRKYIIIYI